MENKKSQNKIKVETQIYTVISWCRNNQDTLLLIGIGLLFQLIFFIGVIISGTCH
jgi:hypothetical protein